MNMPMWFSNVTFWSAQVALLVLAGGFLPRFLQIRQPRVLLAYWRALLAICLLLPFLQPWHRAQYISTIAITPGIASAIPASTPAAIHWHFPGIQIIAQIIGVAILAGITVRFVILALGLLKLRQFRQASSPIPSLAESATGIEEMRTRVNTHAEFRLSADVDSPVTFGLVRPVILLPERFRSLDARFQTAIACHELLHVRRHDWTHHLAEEILRAALWFHPAIAWLIARVRLAREQTVDLEVIRLTGARKTYLEALLEFTASRAYTAAIPAPLFLVERQLAERVALMIKEVRMSRARLIASLTAIACCLALTATFAVWTFPLKASPRSGQNTSSLIQGVSGGVTGGPAGSKIVIADLRINGDVKDMDAVRRRILKGLEGREFDSNSGWLDQIAQINIRAEFQDRGYLKALVKNLQAQTLDSEKHRMLVNVHVDEGEQYRTGDISIVSDESARPLVIPEQELRQQIQLHTGDPYGTGQVRIGLAGIARYYQDHGYADVTVKPEILVNDKNHIVTTTVYVHQGNQFRIQSFNAGGQAGKAQASAPPEAGTGGVGYPKCLDCPSPPFPKTALTSKPQSVTVVLKANIDTGGHATNVEIVKSAGLDFDKSAVEAVQKWRFAPAMGPDGEPVSVVTQIEVAFHSFTGGVGSPKCLDCPAPPFPKAALTSKPQSVTVVLKVNIDTGGHATNVQIVKSAGSDFDKNAVKAVRKWRFAPAMGPDGKPVSVVQQIEVAFHSY